MLSAHTRVRTHTNTRCYQGPSFCSQCSGGRWVHPKPPTTDHRLLQAAASIVPSHPWVTIYKEGAPEKTVDGRSACGSRYVQRSWANPHYSFPILLGGMREGTCASRGFGHFERNETVQDPPVPGWPHALSHNLSWSIWTREG